jgi:hypothetical protein
MLFNSALTTEIYNDNYSSKDRINCEFRKVFLKHVFNKHVYYIKLKSSNQCCKNHHHPKSTHRS